MRFRRRGPGSAWWRAGGSEAPSPGLACGLLNRRICTSLSKGTCAEAVQAQRPVLEADLVVPASGAGPGTRRRRTNVGPAQCSRSRCRLAQRASGVLDIYQNRSEPMGDVDIGCALTFADIAMNIFLDMVLDRQAERFRRAGGSRHQPAAGPTTGGLPGAGHGHGRPAGQPDRRDGAAARSLLRPRVTPGGTWPGMWSPAGGGSSRSRRLPQSATGMNRGETSRHDRHRRRGRPVRRGRRHPGRGRRHRQCSLPFASFFACGACPCCAYGCRGEQQ